jgi:preprotein translocase subunit SecG
MENVLLAIQLILALLLVGVVLLQRSEGGGLGMGSGGGVVSGRAAATALGKVTWGLAILFIASSIGLTVFSARDSASTSVIDQIGGTVAPATPAPATDTAPATTGLGAVPATPTPSTDAPATPPPVKN